jgi:hypothetical protein
MAKKKRVKKELSGIKMINSRGKEVPVEMIRKDHLKKDKIVSDIFKMVDDMQGKLVRVKGKVMAKTDTYKNYLAKAHKTDIGDLNNLTLTNYSNTEKVIISSADIVQLDDKRQIAEAKIKSCFARWGEGAHPYLKTVVDELFKTNKEGYVNITELRALKQYEINDTEWQEAMELLNEAEIIVGKRQYLRLQRRPSIKDKWETVDLNFSSLEVD